MKEDSINIDSFKNNEIGKTTGTLPYDEVMHENEVQKQVNKEEKNIAFNKFYKLLIAGILFIGIVIGLVFFGIFVFKK